MIELHWLAWKIYILAKIAWGNEITHLGCKKGNAGKPSCKRETRTLSRVAFWAGTLLWSIQLPRPSASVLSAQLNLDSSESLNVTRRFLFPPSSYETSRK